MAGVVGQLAALVGRTVEGLGYELVDIERAGGGLLRVTIDTQREGASVTVDDCERVSHQLSHLFAVEDVDYERLEVSSPGLDRPLKTARDYRRFTGAEVQLQLREPLNGRKRWRGVVLAVVGDAGVERVQLAVVPQAQAREAVRRLPRAGARGARSGTEVAQQERIEFAVADVDRARLVPVLDFRSGR